MTNDQIKRLLEQALSKSNSGDPYDVELTKLVIQIELIITMLDEQITKQMCDGGKDIGDIK